MTCSFHKAQIFHCMKEFRVYKSTQNVAQDSIACPGVGNYAIGYFIIGQCSNAQDSKTNKDTNDSKTNKDFIQFLKYVYTHT